MCAVAFVVYLFYKNLRKFINPFVDTLTRLVGFEWETHKKNVDVQFSFVIQFYFYLFIFICVCVWVFMFIIFIVLDVKVKTYIEFSVCFVCSYEIT